MRTFSPVPPYQFLEGVNTDVVRVHVLDTDVALLEVLFLNLVRVSRTAGEEQHDDQHRPVGVVGI